MKIKVFDSLGIPQTVEVEDHRFIAFKNFIEGHQNILGVPGTYPALDADGGYSFAVSQLAYTEAKVFEVQYQPTQAEKFIPQDFSAGEAVDSIRYEILDYVGNTDDESPKSNVTPTVDVAYAENSFSVAHGQIGYSYSQHDLRVSAHLRKPLPEAKLRAAMDIYRRRMNRVGLFGNSQKGLYGLFNNPLVPRGSLPYGSWGAADRTVEEIVSDMNYMIYTPWVASQFNDVPNMMILPPAAYKIVSTRQVPYTNTTILNYFKANNLAKDRGVDIDVDVGFNLDTAGSGGVSRSMTYVKDTDHVVQHIPLPLRFLAPQLEGLLFNIPGEYRYCGTHIRYVNSAFYGDGA